MHQERIKYFYLHESLNTGMILKINFLKHF
jgi:hypothetical protein